MKVIKWLVLLLITCSIIVEFSQSVKIVYAETDKTEIMDEEFLKLSYKNEVKQNSVYWQLFFEKKGADEDQLRRLKIKITDDKDQPIDYPEMENMIEEDGWLKEKLFSSGGEGQLSFELPSSVTELKLYVQMDQQRSSDSDRAAEIQEDILEQNKPFLLKTGKTSGNQEETASSKVEVKGSSEQSTDSNEFVGPAQRTFKTRMKASATADTIAGNQMYNPLYVNKKPQYTTDTKGTYPKFSWQPDGQKNVINHQGGFEKNSGWDNVSSWNVAQDNHTKSYIHYGDDAANSNISLRKYAQQTDKEDEFKIKLNVRGNTTYKPGVDIVFLLDNSDSMSVTTVVDPISRKKNAEEALETILTNLKKVNEPSVENIRIGAHIFSDYTYNAWGDDPSEIRDFQLSKNTADWDKMLKEYKRADPMGATFTQRGLTEAKDIFDASSTSSDRHKLLFVLTDGAPNLSWKTNDNGTPNEDMFLDKLHFKNFISGTKGNYNGGDVLGTTGFKTTIVPAYRGLINSHITTTNSAAMDLKNAGIEIHTIALKLMVNTNELNKRPELLRGLYKMSTKKANATNGPDNDTADDFHFYNVEKGDDLTGYFNKWYETIIRTADKGKITDPLGDMVDLVGTPTWKQVDSTGKTISKEDEPNIAVSNNGRQLDVSNVNLTGNQEIEIEYTVRLKTADPSFVSGQWYPTNGLTTLQPTPERTTDLLEFGSPSVKYQKADFVIPVEKIWSDTYKTQANYWQLRPDKISATLQKLNGSTWQDVETKELSAENSWKANFSAVEGGSGNTYRVVEATRTTGYKQPVLNQTSFTSETMASGGIKITNELLQGNYQFWKFKEDGKSTFTGDLPKFSIKRSDGKVLAENVTPDSKGKVSVSNFAIGNYIVEETYVPAGFQKMDNFEIKVTENNPPTSLVFKVNNSTEDYHAINRLKDFTLTIEKVDSEGKQLSGASFKLSNESGYEATKTGGPLFSFTGLRPGIYTLTEVKSPDGYEQIKDPLLIDVQEGGVVSVGDHPNISGSGGINGGENTINLKVMNKKIRNGALPSTGESGIRRFFLIAGLLGSVGLSLCATYLYRSKKSH